MRQELAQERHSSRTTAAGERVGADRYALATSSQEKLKYVKDEQPVELALDLYPGQILKEKVKSIWRRSGEGQFAPGGTIPKASMIGSQGLLAVKIRLTGETRSLKIPLGTGGTVAIYTDHGKPVHIISQVTIRMKKWLLYVIPS